MSYRKTFLLIAALSLGFGAAPVAQADSVPAHHGGQVQDAGPYHIELVAKPNELMLYVLGSGGKSVDTKGATGTATVLSRKAKETVSLAPAGGNAIKGSGKFEIEADTKIVVSVTLPGQQPAQARFAPGEGGHVGGHK